MKNLKNLKPSQFGKLNLLDVIKAVILCVVALLIVAYLQLRNTGTIDWQYIDDTVLSTLLAYLSKNLIQNENGTFGKGK